MLTQIFSRNINNAIQHWSEKYGPAYAFWFGSEPALVFTGRVCLAQRRCL